MKKAGKRKGPKQMSDSFNSNSFEKNRAVIATSVSTTMMVSADPTLIHPLTNTVPCVFMGHRAGLRRRAAQRAMFDLMEHQRLGVLDNCE
jgi:hypothetical protein